MESVRKGLEESPERLRQLLKKGLDETLQSADRLRKSNWQRTLVIYVSATALSFGIIALIITLLGKDPVRAYSFFILETVGSRYGISETLLRATPLLFIGLGLAIAFSGRFWNIGAEGQMYFGVIFSSWVALTLYDDYSPIITFPLILLLGFAGGALWALVPALLKVKFGVNEIISTLMLNFVAIYILQYLVYDPWKDPMAQQNMSVPFPEMLRLVGILPGTRLHAGLLLALVCVPLVMVILKKSVLGYEIRVMGGSVEAARYGGIDITWTTLKLALLSGGLAGLAGMSEVFGIQYRAIDGFSLSFGFTAIMVCFLAKNKPLGVLIMAVFFGAIIEGGDAMQRGAGVPMAVSSAMMGLVLVLVLLIEMLLQYRMRGEKNA